MPHPSLIPSTSRLNADGKLVAVRAAGLLGRLRRPVVLLSRDLCSFSLFEAPVVPKGKRKQAARLYARSASPYLLAEVAFVKAGEGFAIWWWDLARVRDLIDPATPLAGVVLKPETLAQPAGSGWRVVKLALGYEAQLWRSGALVASAWRLTRFDDVSWGAFARVQRSESDAPISPPAPETLPVADHSEAFALSAGEISRADALRAGVMGLATLTLALSVFWVGQGLSLSRSTAELEEEAAGLRAATPSRSASLETRVELERLRAFQDIETRTSPLTAAGAVLGGLALYDLTPSALAIDEGSVSATLPYAAVDQASDLIREFEESGYFFDIEPRTDAANRTITFEMKTVGGAPPLAAE